MIDDIEIDLKNYRFVAGVDEAGRGPLVGSVVAAAVILDEENPIEGLNDSKKLTAKKREKLALEIKLQAKSWSIATIGPEVIDEINILQASLLAMKKAVEALVIAPDFALIDGNKLPDLSCEAEAIVKGDARVKSIAAASILAKVERDQQMQDLHKEYPQYEFDRHKGYPTKVHMALLEEHGPCPEHRKTFGPVRRLLEG
ncbi:MAG: ribonuclease HII [endosymbiont of Galathealinum brachiosum]|uniref:Ribonuclease HII n=1 Tax=endosymbiont of Galathealinum brachiosum TaxID=2200906 RepID=A0A370DK57_9GAMM|nr:MAG: ribonuclease HII [endosymbiont of Galathealinum brachiosum]